MNEIHTFTIGSSQNIFLGALEYLIMTPLLIKCVYSFYYYIFMLMTMAPIFNKTIFTNIIVNYRLNINLYKYIKMTLYQYV